MVTELAAGDKVGRYRIVDKLGEGGMGSVYQARDDKLERLVAIKFVNEAPGEGDEQRESHLRLMREARAAAALEHENAVSIFDVGERGTSPYIVMEHVEGRTLRAVLNQEEPATAEVLGWMTDVAHALSAAHAQGLVHRDIKPENVMVRSDGKVKVVDFGIARHASADPNAPTVTAKKQGAGIETLTAKGIQVGTVQYMAPEQVRGEALDGRADQFSWGVCAYECLAGKSPWRPQVTALGFAGEILTYDPPALHRVTQRVPSHVSRVIAKAMSKAPDDRYADMDALIAALQAGPADADADDGSDDAASLKRYSSQQIRLVIERALQGSNDGDARFTHSEMVAAAREVGVEESALKEALASLEQPAASAKDKAPPDKPTEEGFFGKQRREAFYNFFRHLLIYVVVNGAIWFGLGQPHWQRWMLFGWGLGLAIQLVNVLMPDREEAKRRSVSGSTSASVATSASATVSTPKASTKKRWVTRWSTSSRPPFDCASRRTRPWARRLSERSKTPNKKSSARPKRKPRPRKKPQPTGADGRGRAKPIGATMHRLTIRFGIITAALGLCAVACDQPDPAGTPATSEAPAADTAAEAPEAPARDRDRATTGKDERRKGRKGAPGAMLFKKALKELDLSDEQRATIEGLKRRKPDEAARAALSELREALAAGARAGELDDALIDSKLATLQAQGVAKRDKMLEDLNTLHATLTAVQRTTLVTSIKEKPEGERDRAWFDRDDGDSDDDGDAAERPGKRRGELGKLGKLLRGIDLTDEQRTKLKEVKGHKASREGMKAKRAAKRKRMAAMLEAFSSDTFDANALAGDDDMSDRMHGKMARKVEMVRIAIGILDETQREQLASNLERESKEGKRGKRGDRERTAR